MRRKIQTVNIRVGSNFYRMIEAQRKILQEKIGFKRNLTSTDYTEMLARSGQLKIPKLKINLFKNAKKQKG